MKILFHAIVLCKKITEGMYNMNFDVVIIGAGPGGIFAAYELAQKNENLKIAVFEAGHELAKRKCPIDGDKIKTCISCKSCSIMSGFGGAGAFSDGKYNITNDWASHCSGLSCCRAWALGYTGSVVMAHKLSCPIVCVQSSWTRD